MLESRIAPAVATAQTEKKEPSHQLARDWVISGGQRPEGFEEEPTSSRQAEVWTQSLQTGQSQTFSALLSSLDSAPT